MPAYLIVEIASVRDDAAYAAYRERVSPGLEAAGGRYLVRGGRPTALHGSWVPPRMVIVRFASMSEARNWWISPDYADLKALRAAATETRMLLVDGEPEGAAAQPAGVGTGAEPGYLLFDLATADDAEGSAELREGAAAPIAAAGATCLAWGGRIEVLEGEWIPSRIGLVRFTSLEEACGWWAAPASAERLALLDASNPTSVVALEGIAGDRERRLPSLAPALRPDSAASAVAPIHIERTARSRLPGVALSDVAFSSVFSDHMLYAEFRDGSWQETALRPYGPLPITPSMSVIQYAVSVFEGLKAQRAPDGTVTLFRAGENARRLNRSARRMAMPEVPESLFLGGLRQLLRLDEGWVPPAGQGALYVRPCLFSMDEKVRVQPADRFAFVIFTFPFAAYYSAPLDVLVTDRYVRAFPGGTGAVKPAGNYAPTLLADLEARHDGFATVLWLDGVERRYIEECGVMNVFFVLEEGGSARVVTPGLTGTILPGITRDSVVTLLGDMGHPVEERRVAVEELLEHHRAGRLRECFGTGTAATLSHIRRIRHGEHDMVLPPVEERTVGPAVRERLVAIASGRAPDRHGWVEPV